MDQVQNIMGAAGMYCGVVEDRMDPKQLGRCRVRVLGVHTENLNEIPSESLPWAYPMMPITSASMNGIGDAPVGPVEGTWVVIFFRDGHNFQEPIILNVYLLIFLDKQLKGSKD